MDIKIIYEDNDVLVVDKPAGVVVFPEGESLKSEEKTLIYYLIENSLSGLVWLLREMLYLKSRRARLLYARTIFIFFVMMLSI